MSAYLANLNRLPAWLHAYGVAHVVACPGSRNAPLLEILHRSGLFTMTSIRDERSAAFIALGMSQRGIPAAICCTSGTAVLNLYPAICEAYYQRVPLIAITADRPPELIDQWDGQTIRQQNIFEQHILESYQWPDELDHPEQAALIDQLMNGAMAMATGSCNGPVHINIPLRDPIYRDFNRQPEPLPIPHVDAALQPKRGRPLLPEPAERTLIICGMHQPDKRLKAAIMAISEHAPVLCDIASGMMEHSVHPHWERAFSFADHIPELLQADQLISIGTNMLSKSLKQWLRKHKPEQHFHVAESGWVGDPFGTHPRHLEQHPAHFLEAYAASLNAGNNYLKSWQDWCQEYEHRYEKKRHLLPWSEWQALEQIFQQMPEGLTLQLGNSMPVRYAAWLSPRNTKSVFANRGSSGIDGCVSTALGYALAHPEEQVLLIVGDVGFFYDGNAMWNEAKPANLRIVLLNNGGGNIFRIIDGPQHLEVTKEFLETAGYRNAASLCAELGCAYIHADKMPDPEQIAAFFMQQGPVLLELTFPPESGPKVLQWLKNI